MCGRENLKTYTSCELYDKSSDEFEVGEAYLKGEVDKVMDAMESRIKELEETKWHDISKPLINEDGEKYYDLPVEDGEYQVVYKSSNGAKVVTTDCFDVDNCYWEGAICPNAYTHWAELSPLPPEAGE